MKIKHTLFAVMAAMTLSVHAHAAIEIDEKDFGPTYSSAAADILIAKPLQVAGALAGTALHLVGLPFSYASDSVESSAKVLVEQPWQALNRCVGCSTAYDNYIKNQQYPTNEVRFVVDRPSEVIINTDQNVVVNPY